MNKWENQWKNDKCIPWMKKKNNVKLLVKMGYKLIYYLFNGNKIATI